MILNITLSSIYSFHMLPHVTIYLKFCHLNTLNTCNINTNIDIKTWKTKLWLHLWLLLTLMHPNWWCWNFLDNILLVGMKNRKDLLDEAMFCWIYLFEFTFVKDKKSTMLLLCKRIVDYWMEQGRASTWIERCCFVQQHWVLGWLYILLWARFYGNRNWD